jgi:hypothetical protein
VCCCCLRTAPYTLEAYTEQSYYTMIFRVLLRLVGGVRVLLGYRLAEQARVAGVAVTLEIWDTIWRVWQAWAGVLPEGQQAIEKIGAFMRQQISR